MAKKSRTKNRDHAAAAPAAGEVGPRQPCPCGSGKRYKACHGSSYGVTTPFVARPFEGLAGECDVIALRELVPAGTAPLTLAEGVPGAGTRTVKLCTLLPAGAPAVVRDSGEVWLGLQVQHNYGDPSRDLAAVLLTALEQAEAGQVGTVGLTVDPGEGPRLQDLVANTSLDVTVHEGFDYWIADVDERDSAMAAALEQVNATAQPTVRLKGVEGAYWTDVGTKEHLRWVMEHDEDVLLTALARLHAGGKDSVAADSRLVGMFRAHGLLAPVWDLPVGTGAEALEEGAQRFAADLDAALADTGDLTQEERSARAGLANRQVTIR